MQFTMEEEEDFTPLPEDSVFRARLEEIKYRTFTWTDKKTGDQKEGNVLEWWWEITGSYIGEEFIGRKTKGECDAKITTRGTNRFREWAEALLGRTIPIGMQVDTDDLVGLEADIVIGHRADKKDPSKSWAYVETVVPLDGQRQSLEPPF